jgi:serine/threonine protein kinase
MGDVYRAKDTRLPRTVAIKVLPADTAGDAGARARFEREARAIATLSHPHICVVHDVGHHPSTSSGQGVDYLVMELLEGETLANRLKKGALPLADVLAIATQLADALAAAHK